MHNISQFVQNILTGQDKSKRKSFEPTDIEQVVVEHKGTFQVSFYWTRIGNNNSQMPEMQRKSFKVL